jgi:hypothetical protein
MASTAPTITSSPSSGPVGTNVSVSGSGLPVPDGTPVSLGYINSTNTCTTVGNVQNGTSGGSFSGSFSWPSSAPFGIYTVCAIINNQSFSAQTFMVLSPFPPQVSITPNTLQENEQATITATNYVPAGTSITFLWTTTGGTVIQTLGSAVSNSVGTALFTFPVPVSSLASGSYLIEAEGGGGQPPAYFSSVGFTYTAPVPTPSPTPRPKPSPTPRPKPSPTPPPTPVPTQPPLPTATAAVGVTTTVQPASTAGVTATVAPTQSGGSTPTTLAGGNGTPTTFPTSTSGNGGSSASSGQSNKTLLVLGILGGVITLAVAVGLAMLFRRWQSSEQEESRGISPYPLFDAGQFAQDTTTAMPGWGAEPFTMAGPPGSPPTMPVGAGADYTLPGNWQVNGLAAGAPGTPLQAPPAYRALLNPAAPLPDTPDGAWQVPADPTLDAMRRQAQTGLWVEPIARDDGV